MVRTRVGYAGGSTPNPTYHRIGDHTETIQIEFDPSKIGYARLLEIFWSEHSPCLASGSRQYASLIFIHNDEQRKTVEASKAAYEKEHGRRVKTEILPYTSFTLAEDYHQKYQLRNSGSLMREFAAIYPKDADFVKSTAAARVNGYLGGNGSREQLEREIDSLGLSVEGRERLRDAAAK